MTDDSPEIRGPIPNADEGDSQHQVGGDEHEEGLPEEESEAGAAAEGTWRSVGQDEILPPGCDDAITAYEMVVAEGLEEAASLGRLLYRPAWAAGTAHNLAAGIAVSG
jgi:hypothetical protein